MTWVFTDAPRGNVRGTGGAGNRRDGEREGSWVYAPCAYCKPKAERGERAKLVHMTGALLTAYQQDIKAGRVNPIVCSSMPCLKRYNRALRNAYHIKTAAKTQAGMLRATARAMVAR